MNAANLREITTSVPNTNFMDPPGSKYLIVALFTFLLISLSLFAAAYSQPLRGKNQAQGNTRMAEKPKTLPESSSPVLLNRIEVRANPSIADGCWVWLFPEPTYTGTDSVAIAGPTDLISPHFSGGLSNAHEVESIKVGPKATLIVYENLAFQSAIQRFKPGSNTQWVRKGKKLKKPVDFIKISCIP